MADAPADTEPPDQFSPLDRVIAAPLSRLSRAGDRVAALPGVRNAHTPLVLAVAAVGIALGTQFAVTSHRGFAHAGYAFALAALLFAGAAFAATRSRTGAAALEPIVIPRNVEIALLLGVIGLAAFFRFFRFSEFPPGLWYDEAINGIDAFSIIDRDHLTVWRETNFGHSTIYFYLLIASFKVFGYTVFAMRLVCALAGLAAVVAFYFLARRLLGVVPGLVATALLAVSRFAVTFSRITWEASLEPLLEVMAVLFFVRALETRNKFYFFLAGGSLAAGIYTYLAFRIIPFVMLFLLFYVAVTQWHLIKRNLVGLVVYAVSFVVVVTPLAQYALQNQDAFLARTRDVNIFKEIDQKNSYEPLRSNIEKSVKLVNVSGDLNGRHNLPRAPMVDDVSAALFVLGIAVSLWSFREWRKGGLAGWFALALFPGIFTISIENPSMIRGVGAIPPVFLIAGLAVAQAQRSFSGTVAGRYVFAVLAIAIVVSATTLNYRDFFERQAKNIEVNDGFTPWFTQIGEIAAREAGHSQVYINEEYRGHPAITVLTRGKKHLPYQPTKNLILDSSKGDAVLLITPKQFGIIPTLRTLYPNLTEDDSVDRFGRVFFSDVRIPASDMDDLHRVDFSLYRGTEASGTPIETSRAPIGREWTEADLAGGPVTAVWEANLWIPTSPGIAAFVLESPGQIAVEVDGQSVASSAAGSLTQAVHMDFGERRIRVVTTVERPGQTSVRFNVDGSEGMDLSRLAYGRTVGDRGFQAVFRQGTEFTTEPALIARVPFALGIMIAPDLQAVEYRAVYDAQIAGDYSFALDGISSAQLFVDDQLVVDNGGNHGTRRVEGTTQLRLGEHLLSIRYVAAGLADWAAFVRPPLAEWHQFDGTDLRPPTGPYVPPALAVLRPDPRWGNFGQPLEGLGEPNGIDILPDGTVVVAHKNILSFVSDESGSVASSVELDVGEISDIGHTASGAIVVLDAERKALLTVDRDGNVTGRTDDGVFQSAAGLAVRNGDTAIVASPSGGVLYEVPLSPVGQPEAIVGRTERPLGEERLLQPSDAVVATDGTLYVNDFERKRVIAFSDGHAVRGFPGVSGTSKQLPHIATYGKLVILTDPQNLRLVIYDINGKLRGTYSFVPQQKVARPIGLAIGANGTVYVAASERGVIFRLSLEISPQLATELAAIP